MTKDFAALCGSLALSMQFAAPTRSASAHTQDLPYKTCSEKTCGTQKRVMINDKHTAEIRS